MPHDPSHQSEAATPVITETSTPSFPAKCEGSSNNSSDGVTPQLRYSEEAFTERMAEGKLHHRPPVSPSKTSKRQRLDLRVDLSEAPKGSILSFMHAISDEEKARRRTAGFEEIAEFAAELKAQREREEVAKKLKVREDATRQKQEERKRGYERDVDAGVRSEDYRLVKRPECPVFAVRYECSCSISS